MESIIKYKFQLPFPLSVNAIYKMAIRGRYGNTLPHPHIYLTTEAKDLKDEMALMIRNQALAQKMPKWKDTYLIFELTPFNIRKDADTDNLYKLTQDAFALSGYVDNDKYFINRTISRQMTPDKIRKVEVVIYETKGMPSQEDIKRYFYWLNNEEIMLDK